MKWTAILVNDGHQGRKLVTPVTLSLLHDLTGLSEAGNYDLAPSLPPVFIVYMLVIKTRSSRLCLSLRHDDCHQDYVIKTSIFKEYFTTPRGR